MRKLTLAGSTAVGVVLGGILFNATSSYADMPTIDATVQAAVQAVGSAVQAVQKAVQQVQSAVNTVGTFLGDNTFGSVQQLLQQGFTQTSNYLKAQVGAQEQITDASNTAMARFQRDMRNAQIRDEQTASPAHCTALDGGVSTQAAAVQAFSVGTTIARIHDLRAEAGSLTHLASLTEGGESSEGHPLGAGAAALTPGEWVESMSMKESVKEALRRLTPRQRQVLVLYFLEGLAKSEIADILGVGRSRITQLLQQGLHNLRLELGLSESADADDLLPDSSPI